MSAFGDYLELALLNWIRGTAFPAPPANVYVALYTTPTTDAGGGTEVSGGAYARQAVAPAGWTAPVDDGGSYKIENVAQIAWAVATASWGLITHAAVHDALTGGNRLYHGPINVPKQIDASDQFKAEAGDLELKAA